MESELFEGSEEHLEEESQINIVVEKSAPEDEDQVYLSILSKIEVEKNKAKARAERFGLQFVEENFKLAAILTSNEHKIFCERTNSKPTKFDAELTKLEKKTYEVRDREYTEKLLEKVTTEIRQARERSERFGIPFTEPRMDVILTLEEHRKYLSATAGRNPLAAESAPIAGIDTLCDEERERQRQRAERFSGPSADSTAAETDEAATAARREEEERAAEAARREARAAKFGLAIDDAPYGEDLGTVFCRPRRPLEPDPKFLPETLHCYGVDRLSTAEILDYFKEYAPAYVLWLDDSSGNVVFGDAFNARRAYATIGKTIRLPPPASGDADDAAAGSSPGPGPADAGAAGGGGGGDSAAGPGWVADAVWRRGPNYTKDGVTYPVLLRFATTKDVKAGKPTKSQRLWIGNAARGGRGGSKGGGGAHVPAAATAAGRRPGPTRSVSVHADTPAARLDIADLRSCIGKARRARDASHRAHPYAPAASAASGPMEEVEEGEVAEPMDAAEADHILALQPGPWVLTADDEEALQAEMDDGDAVAAGAAGGGDDMTE